jgi:hypothetical protein
MHQVWVKRNAVQMPVIESTEQDCGKHGSR